MIVVGDGLQITVPRAVVYCARRLTYEYVLQCPFERRLVHPWFVVSSPSNVLSVFLMNVYSEGASHALVSADMRCSPNLRCM